MAVLALAFVGCASGGGPRPGPPSTALAGTSDTTIGRLVARWNEGTGPGESSVHVLARGLDSLVARRALIDRAERSLDLQYYIWRTDGSGRELAEAVVRAADRGVRVRLLLDDWGARPGDAELSALAAHPKIEVRLFNPLSVRWAPLLGFVFEFDRANRRMHNKAMVADNQAAIVGGRNVGGEYFEGRPELEFSDVDLLLAGPVVPQVSAGFDLFWNCPVAIPMESLERAAAPAVGATEPGPTGEEEGELTERLDRDELKLFHALATAVQDDPDKVDAPDQPELPRHLGRRLVDVVGDVSSELLLVTPYFVPGKGGVEQLRALRNRGIRVRVVTNSLDATDVTAVFAGYEKYRKALLEMGVEIYEVRADPMRPRRRRGGIGRGGSSAARVSLHAKLMVVDRRIAFVGSMNIDPRSIKLNTENGVVVESVELAGELAAGIERVLGETAYRVELHEGRLRWVTQDGDREECFDSEPKAGWWLRTKAKVLSWLPIEGLL